MKILGCFLIISGIILGLYLGIWVCFIGGIIGLINAVVDISNGLGVDAMAIGIGVGKIIFAGLVGWLSALTLIYPGVSLISKNYGK